MAPGKVVLSGAYSVLEGAPAIVAAVDRYVVVDTGRRGKLLTHEVRAAGITEPYWFDASALRHADRKLGLGSSAAILVATLAAHRLAQSLDLATADLVDWVYPRAIEAHRAAQGGGSGVDVAAACHGGILEFRRIEGRSNHRRLSAPSSLCIEVWASSAAASTPHMLAAVRSLAERAPTVFRRDMQAQATAAELTLGAWKQADWPKAVRGFVAQRHALERLGIDAQIPIVTPELKKLADLAEQHSAAVVPAGAGGGDIALYVGPTPSDFLSEALTRAEHSRLAIVLGATGVRAAPDPADANINKPGTT